jgi:sulfatase-like protein
VALVTGNRWLRWTALVAALVLLDASLTFENVWPTPAIRWQGDLSIELAACILALVVAHRRLGPASRPALAWLSVLWLLLVVGRYADVTAPALYGRDVNLYWDLRYVPAVAALLAHAAPPWLLLAAAAAVVLTLAALYMMMRWALGRIADAIAVSRERRILVLLAAAAAVLFTGQRWSARLPGEPGFSTPVVGSYARQARLVAHALTRSTSLAPSPSMNTDLSLLRGADVLLVFIESYGAVSFERPEFAARLASSRVEFERAVHATNRDLVSAYVESPTFGGSSWLAHISLLSGVEVRDPDTNARLMTEKRDTMITTFARHGYRTVAMMPGLRQLWPEGTFYGFDEIYGAERVDYHGPEFGWFAIPDQFAIARLDLLEVSRRSGAPLFVFFPTLSTHMPFSPAPPYQPDWRRMLTSTPYDGPEIVRAYEEERELDWVNFGPAYVNAVTYAYASIGGYLRLRADHDFILILLGDHQPPALVTGEGAPWDVPVHVIASRRQVLDRLLARGFQTGLTPRRPSLGRMHELLPVLLGAFGDPE